MLGNTPFKTKHPVLTGGWRLVLYWKQQTVGAQYVVLEDLCAPHGVFWSIGCLLGSLLCRRWSQDRAVCNLAGVSYMRYVGVAPQQWTHEYQSKASGPRASTLSASSTHSLPSTHTTIITTFFFSFPPSALLPPLTVPAQVLSPLPSLTSLFSLCYWAYLSMYSCLLP